MIINKLFLRFIAVFGFAMMFAVSGWGVVLDMDTFDSNVDGWSGSNVVWNSGSGGRLFMDRDDAASKTFSFGAGYANQQVNVTLDATKIDTWEGGERIIITANSATPYNSNTAGAISFNATLNGSGQLVLSVLPDTDANAEDLYIDNVIISYAPPPEVNVIGVVDGDSTPSGGENTDFGSALVSSETVEKTYTIQNTGTGDLTLGTVSVGGDFTVTAQPTSPVAAGGSTTFTIRFDPTAIGTRIATISFGNNDSNENPYDFSISGIGDGPPVMGNIPDQTTTVGSTFSLNIASYVTLTNSDPIIVYTLTGTLPTGLSFNSTTGVIDGTPTAVTNATSFTITATDNDGVSNSDTFTITVNAPSADLAITKTATPSPAVINNTMQYTLRVINNGPATANDITIKDVLNSNVTYQTSYGADWICDYTSATRTVSCVHPTDLANGATADDVTIVVVTPSTAQTVSNTASVSSAIPDTVAGNNTSTVSTVIGNASSTNNQRDFTLQKSYNINGNVKMIGNSVLGTNINGTCTTLTNNDVSSPAYIDLDGDGTTFNSTSADLILPPGITSANIKYAGLYWQGRIKAWTNVGANEAAGKTAASTVKLKLSGSGYQSIISNPAKFNWANTNSLDYQGIADITQKLKNDMNSMSSSIIASSGYNQPIWIADIKAKIGEANMFGAWSIIVVYEDQSDSLKNISVYDGYKGIKDESTNSATVSLSGFLTPSSGAVNASFFIFGGEGDVGYGDKTSLSNDANPGGVNITSDGEIFTSSVSFSDGNNNNTSDPLCPNTLGVDIHSYSVGDTIIKNNQTSTTVRMTGFTVNPPPSGSSIANSYDTYFPGLFAFSTELYTPDVCYLEDVTFNGLPITGANVPVTDENVEYEVTISNKADEPAKGVFIEKVFNKPNEIMYVPSSMQIAPIPGTTYSAKSDTIGDDTAEYSTETNTTKFLVGSGATWYTGGTLVKDAVTKFKYQAKIGDQNASENTYLVSYRNDLLHVTFTGIPTRKCSDFNNSFGVSASGAYQVVDAGQNCGGQVFTKVVNQAYNLDMVACDTSNNSITPSTTKTIDITYSDMSKNPIGGAPAITSISFPAGNNRISNVPITAYNKAIKSVNLATKRSDEPAWSSISNSFAVRPKNFNLVSTPAAGTKIKAGQNIALQFRGLDALGNEAQDYSDTADINFEVTVADQQPACLTGVFNPDIKSGWNFANGTHTIATNYPEVGIVNITATESTKPCAQRFAYVDCSDSDVSNLNIENGTTALTFIPDHFAVVGALSDKGNGFTYLSSDLNMSADLNITLRAQNALNATTQNYNMACYAKSIDLNVSYTAPVITPANGVGQLLYKEMQTNTNGVNDPIGTQISMNALPPTNIFTQGLTGVGYPDLKINFNRSQITPVNPFAFTVGAIDVADADGVLGTQNLNSNATFVYGRFIPRDVRVFGNVPFTANGWYEVYNKSTIGATTFSASKNDSGWYINSLHTDPIYGDANVTIVVTGTNPTNTTPNVSNGVEKYGFVGQTPPYSAKAHINTDEWLWYGANASPYVDPSVGNTNCLTHPCFNISIVPPIGASGSAKSEVKDTKGNKKSSGSGIWKSTSDYAPAIR